MVSLPDKVKAILRKKAFAHVATLMPDGSPQVSPVWIDVDGETILINSARGRRKVANLGNDARVALSVTDPDNPYDAVMIRGRVVEATTEGADRQIDALAKKYLGKDKYPFKKPGEVRVLYKIEPERVSMTG
jgi:PPOX class probable F420-dependent enzyme